MFLDTSCCCTCLWLFTCDIWGSKDIIMSRTSVWEGKAAGQIRSDCCGADAVLQIHLINFYINITGSGCTRFVFLQNIFKSEHVSYGGVMQALWRFVLEVGPFSPTVLVQLGTIGIWPSLTFGSMKWVPHNYNRLKVGYWEFVVGNAVGMHFCSQIVRTTDSRWTKEDFKMWSGLVCCLDFSVGLWA